MTKPIGPICNLDCTYCFYLEKESLYPGTSQWRMSDQVLERYTRQYLASQSTPEVTFAWQGGEPTLCGVEFFERALELQKRYANGRTVTNTFQTNGTLLDDRWCELLAREKFLVGLSLDGPRHLHDGYRVDKKGEPTFDRVLYGLNLLRNHGVDFNILCVVHRDNARHPLDVYRFLKSTGATFFQFIPLVERIAGSGFAAPPVPSAPVSFEAGRPGVRSLVVLEETATVAPWSVLPADYGQFLCEIFDDWSVRDIGRIFVQLFEVQLAIHCGVPSSLCVFRETCGDAVAMEHNGDVYSCDHFVYPRYKLGNIAETDIAEMVNSTAQRQFGNDKRDTLPRYCRECEVRQVCHGECPKHRFATTPDGEPGLNYLCEAYKRFAYHAAPKMRKMAQLLDAGRPAGGVMRPDPGTVAGRNDPCPCGSGRKFKKCCGA